WEGRIGVAGCCTSAIDRAHDVIQKLGSRFIFIRLADSPERREESGRQAIRNVFRVTEETMAGELNAAIEALLAEIDSDLVDTSLSDEEVEQIRRLGDLATRVRSGVDYDRSGRHVMDVHGLEAPTRFPKSLTQMFRGLLLLGHSRQEAIG